VRERVHQNVREWILLVLNNNRELMAARARGFLHMDDPSSSSTVTDGDVRQIADEEIDAIRKLIQERGGQRS
jgi:hypothetical protein